MKFLKEILEVWKRNRIPAFIGLLPLAGVVSLLFCSNFSAGTRDGLLIAGLGIAAWVAGVFFPRKSAERGLARNLAALLPLAVLAGLLGLWGVKLSKAPGILSISNVPGVPSELQGSLKLIAAVSVTCILACYLAFMLYFYLAGWTGRAIGREKTGRSLLAGFLVWLLAAPALSGLSAAIELALPLSDKWLHIPSDFAFAYCFGFLLAIPLLGVWIALLSRRDGQRLILRALRDFALGTAGSFLLFGVACAITLYRAHGALELAKQTGRPLDFSMPDDPAGAEALETLLRTAKAWSLRCSQRNPPIELPLTSAYLWNEPNSPVTLEMRQATVAELESKEAKAYLAAATVLAPRATFPAKYDVGEIIPTLNSLRSAVRRLAGIAAVHHWQGDSERILPFLQLGKQVTRVLDTAPKLALCGLMRIAIDSILAQSLVQLGPDGPQYAQEYRRWLDYFRSTDYTVPDELEFTADYLQKALQWPKELHNPLYSDRSLPFYRRIFVISLMANLVRERVAAQPQIAEFRAAAKMGQRKNLSRFLLESYSAVKWEKHAHARLPTLLALKLYRSLNGRYPESLSELVPELLPALPLDPETGKPFRYTRTWEGFTLSYQLNDHLYSTGSRPEY